MRGKDKDKNQDQDEEPLPGPGENMPLSARTQEKLKKFDDEVKKSATTIKDLKQKNFTLQKENDDLKAKLESYEKKK